MKKMSNVKFRTIMVPAATLLFATGLIATITANQFSASLDFAFGRGEKHIEQVEGISQSDVSFYERRFAEATKSRLAARDVAQKVEEEGATLLKNDGVLPLAKNSKVTPFGYRYVSPFYGGTGSANIDTSDSYVITAEQGLTDSFSVNTEVVNAMKGATPVTMEYADGNEPTNLTEYNSAIYVGHEASCADTTAIIYIARPGTEGYDLNSSTPYDDGTKSQLELTTREKEMIAFAKANCSKTVVLLITPTPMMVQSLQNDSGINAIIWAGLPGAGGYRAVSNILDGTVNPSGKLSDLWYADFYSDPTYMNILQGTITNPAEGSAAPASYMEYEESIYMGYRYYETRFAADNKFTVFGETKGYDDAVVYPFGFGLNYEDDKVTQTFDSISYFRDQVTVKGTIHNESTRPVDEVVQIYVGAPYTANGIEKSSKVLVAFDKYHVEANSEKEFEIKFLDEEMASYDHKKIYSENGSYVLENGTYSIYLGKDSHNSFDSKNITVPTAKVYALEAKTGEAVGKRSSDIVLAENLFDNLNEYVAGGEMTSMSRAKFADSFPSTPTSKALSQKLIDDLKALNYKTNAKVGEVEGSLIYKDTDPTSKAQNGLTLSDLRGYDYNDPRWDELLDQLDYDSDDIDSVITYALYQTSKVEAIGKVETNDNDGTVGLTANWGGNQALAEMFGSKTSPVTSCAYPCAPIQAATFNVDLMEAMGEMISEESLTNNISGWYAPGLNLHRTPFGGRNFEYYSEDPVLSGEIAAASVSGAFTKGGLYAYIKHFALNETDVNRSSIAVWADEQVCRELYFKGFEICVKKAEGELRYYDANAKKQVSKTVKACRGLMTSMNYIGMVSPTNSYELLTNLLRDEWGFEGMVITDFTSGAYKDKNLGYRVGNDLWMAMKKFDLDMATPTAKWAARKAIKNICYVVVNSNAYDKVAPGSKVRYSLSPWNVALISVDAVLGLAVAGSVVWMVLRHLDGKKNPDKYAKEEE